MSWDICFEGVWDLNGQAPRVLLDHARPVSSSGLKFTLRNEDADIFWLEQLALFILGHHRRALASSSSHQHLQQWAWRGVLVHKSLYCWILLAVFSFVSNCCSFAESWAQLHLTIIAHAAGNHQLLLKTNEFQLFYRRESPCVWML